LSSRWQIATGIGDETHLAGLPAPVIDGPDAIIVDREDVTAIDIHTDRRRRGGRLRLRALG
jgi:hypothetical protein